VNAYPTILHIMTGLLIVGLVSNLLVTPIAEKYWMTELPAKPIAAGAH
jgi:hypothetical protein